MTNHPRRSGRAPMTRPSYQKLARELRHFADLIEGNCRRETPRQKQILTQAIINAMRCTRRASNRHNGWDHDPAKQCSQPTEPRC
jgi:hypothetical protein